MDLAVKLNLKFFMSLCFKNDDKISYKFDNEIFSS
jgi:hypothetical protein